MTSQQTDNKTERMDKKMAPLGLNWPMFIMYVVAVPGMIALSWILPETKWWKKIVDEYFSWSE